MELRVLRTFVAVAEAGTVSAAAEALRITQPALSRQIQHLEREIGLRLFDRRGGRLALTAAGWKFLDSARAVLDREAAARKLAQSLAAGRLSRVDIAAPATTLTDVIAPFLATLQPEDALMVVTQAHDSAAFLGLGSTLDLAIVTSPPPRQYRSRPVATLPVWAYVRCDHRWSQQVSVPLAELVEADLIVLTSTFRPRQILDEALIRAGLAPPPLIECGNAQVAQALAAAGRGVAIVSDDPRFDLTGVRIESGAGELGLTLYAAWDARHHAADELDRYVARLSRFCRDRYGFSVANDGELEDRSSF